MKNLYSFFTAYNNEFWHYQEDILTNLEYTNQEYSDKKRLVEELLEKYTNLRKVIDDNEEVNLNEKEVKVLINIMEIYMDIRDIELEEIFFAGMRNAYYLFTKTGIISTNKYLYEEIEGKKINLDNYD